jgi:hypothetical protein
MEAGSNTSTGWLVDISGSVRSSLMMMLQPLPLMQRDVTVCAVTDNILVFNACMKTNI